MEYDITDPNKIRKHNEPQIGVPDDPRGQQPFYICPVFLYPIQSYQPPNNELIQINSNYQNTFAIMNYNQNEIPNEPSNLKSRKQIYGKGFEHQRLKALAHYNEPFDHLEIYELLGRPNKARINEIGEEYNIRFRKEIKTKEYPKFTRNHRRNKSLGVWFFNDCDSEVKSWLKEIGSIDKSN